MEYHIAHLVKRCNDCCMLNIMPRVSITRSAINISLPNGFILPIRWYGLAYIVSYFVIKAQIYYDIQKFKIDINSAELSTLADVSLMGGIIGGRLWYLVFRYFEYGIRFSYKPFHIWEGGMAFQGGLLLGCISGISYLYIIKKRKYIPQMLDIVTSKMPLGIAIGRIGNFMNQEFMNPIFGIPSCIFSSITEGLIPFIILNYVLDFKKYKYINSCLFFMLYSLIRFVNDFFREEEVYAFLNLKFSQYVCIVIFCIAASIFVIRISKNKGKLHILK